jgi:formylglycine-generating enzyme required for sulfatase activity
MDKLRKKTGLAFDLPTEAQREYACRAGTTKALHNDTDLMSTTSDTNVDILACYFYNGGSNGHATVGSYLPNNWGLYDMHGNIWNWCLDWYDVYGGDVTDPQGPATGTERVRRGGTWNSQAAACRSSYRSKKLSNYEGHHTGFRAVCLSAGQ